MSGHHSNLPAKQVPQERSRLQRLSGVAVQAGGDLSPVQLHSLGQHGQDLGLLLGLGLSAASSSRTEFERVLVIVDDEEGTHTQFSYDKYFGIKPLSERDIRNIAEGKETVVDRTRRLFYVYCTRALSDLAVVLFSEDAGEALACVRATGIFPQADIHTLADIN